MAKGSLHVSLTQEALAELERRAKAAGITRQQCLEAWLTGANPKQTKLAKTARAHAPVDVISVIGPVVVASQEPADVSSHVHAATNGKQKAKAEAIKYCPKHGRFCPPGCKLAVTA